jgi:superfamily II DNA or RNA helicase
MELPANFPSTELIPDWNSTFENKSDLDDHLHYLTSSKDWAAWKPFWDKFNRTFEEADEGVYIWGQTAMAPDGTLHFDIRASKFGEYGTKGMSKKPSETTDSYSSIFVGPRVIFWAATYDQLRDLAYKNGFEDFEKDFPNPFAIEQYIQKQRLTRKIEGNDGTEFFDETPKEVVGEIQEFLGDEFEKFGDTIRYRPRKYTEKAFDVWERFINGRASTDTFVLGATTGSGKTAMDLKFLEKYRKKKRADGEISHVSGLLFSSMPDTLENFIRDSKKFDCFYEDGDCIFNFYDAKDPDEVDAFLEATSNQEQGIHILHTSIQDLKDKSTLTDEDIQDWVESEEELSLEDFDLSGRLSDIDGISVDAVMIDEAHQGVLTKKMEAVLKRFDFKYKILITATAYDFLLDEEGEYDFQNAGFLYSREDLYAAKDRGEPWAQEFPWYNYHFLSQKIAHDALRENHNISPEEEFRWKKIFRVDMSDPNNPELVYEDAVVDLFARLLNLNPKDPDETLSIFGHRTNLCSFSEWVGMISIPPGNSQVLKELLIEKLTEYWNRQKRITNVTHDYEFLDVEDSRLDEKIDENFEEKRTIVFTCNKKLTGYDNDKIGWLALLREIGSVKLLEQAIGRPGRPKEDDDYDASVPNKKNCAVFFGGVEGHVKVIDEIIRHRCNEGDYDSLEDAREEWYKLYNPTVALSKKEGWRSIDGFGDLYETIKNSQQYRCQNAKKLLDNGWKSDEDYVQKLIIEVQNNISASDNGGRQRFYDDQSNGQNRNQTRNQGSSDDSGGDDGDIDDDNIERVEKSFQSFFMRLREYSAGSEDSVGTLSQLMGKNSYEFAGERLNFQEAFGVSRKFAELIVENVDRFELNKALTRCNVSAR